MEFGIAIFQHDLLPKGKDFILEGKASSEALSIFNSLIAIRVNLKELTGHQMSTSTIFKIRNQFERWNLTGKTRLCAKNVKGGWEKHFFFKRTVLFDLWIFVIYHPYVNLSLPLHFTSTYNCTKALYILTRHMLLNSRKSSGFSRTIHQ